MNNDAKAVAHVNLINDELSNMLNCKLSLNPFAVGTAKFCDL